MGSKAFFTCTFSITLLLFWIERVEALSITHITEISMKILTPVMHKGNSVNERERERENITYVSPNGQSPISANGHSYTNTMNHHTKDIHFFRF